MVGLTDTVWALRGPSIINFTGIYKQKYPLELHVKIQTVIGYPLTSPATVTTDWEKITG
jgi:V8-like Glu-specific endopeptidase